MTDVPPYFEDVRASAARRWGQLEQDPVLAGPWHQLFKQVQSPRHVVSELLQNADDAGATGASADIQGEEFVFTHNGEDFSEEHFTSLCRFGYSNKRSLHTIGFRGIGFKSTFSLGDEVCLRTPTLSVLFRRSRFTEPIWMVRNGGQTFRTEVRVKIQDQYRLRELKKNLDDWTTSPASLLFFRSIRSLTIGGREIRWKAQGDGPVHGSSWLSLSGTPDRRVLLVQSSLEPFPDESLNEIRQERMVAVDEETTFPPCSVELVLGMEGRLFVILPSGVLTKLPFASNAPFIQDPARVKIKDPEISPTNRWLLERIGQLAAEAMLHWVGRPEEEIAERAGAYALLPDLDRDDHSLEGNCGVIVEEACESVLTNKTFLLLEDGSLAKKNACVAVPKVLLDVWPSDLVSRLFSDNAHPILSRHISAENRKKLINWSLVEQIDKKKVLSILESKQLPSPRSWEQLLLLWSYIADEVVGSYYPQSRDPIFFHILPVQGQNTLFADYEIVRLSEKKLLRSQEDREFLEKYLLVLNQDWVQFLEKQRLRTEQSSDASLSRQVSSAYKIFNAIKLGQVSDVSRIILDVAGKAFQRKDCPLSVYVHVAQLAAALGANVSAEFQFVTRNGLSTPASQNVVADLTGNLDAFVPEKWYEEHVLHEEYGRCFTSCTQEEWFKWITSGRGRLFTFVPFVEYRETRRGKDNFAQFLRSRGVTKLPDYPYHGSHEFKVTGFDFEPDIWKHWEDITKNDPELWGRLMSCILEQPTSYWEKAMDVTATQVASNGRSRQLACTDILPCWISRFRSRPCLQDTNGRYHEPAELLRRTPETDPLFGVEAFVRPEFDTEQTRPLLIRLGARGTPTGPRRLLDRLRALATVDNPPVYEVEKWCHRLDQLLNRCSTSDFCEIKSIFASEKLILTTEIEWAKKDEAFLEADDEDAPGAAVVHSAIHDLSMWRKLGVADRPTGDLATRWLTCIASGKKLSKDELRRVRALLPRYPDRIWLECQHWLNLEGEWSPVEQLSYKLTMQPLIPWSNLFRPIKQKTADLQKLTIEMCARYPFAELPALAERIEDRFDERVDNAIEPSHKSWLIALGSGLARIQLDNPLETERMRVLGQRLANTWCHLVTALESTPYIDGVPSGTPRRVDALWKADTLYVESKSVAKMAKAIAGELGRHFDHPDIADAIKLCFEREHEFIDDYLEENFILIPPSCDAPKPDAISEVEPTHQSVAASTVVEGQTPTLDFGGDDGEQACEPAPGSPEDEVAVTTQEPDLDDAGDNGAIDTPAPRRYQQRPAKPSLIERFAATNGYAKDCSENRFYRENGEWLERASGASFPWERYAPTGDLLQCYWDKDHCIEHEPLQVEAEVWDLCTKHPEKYSLLLAAPDDTPVEYSGKRLCALRESGQVTLFLASYRLVYKHDAQSYVKEEAANGGGRDNG